MSIHNPFLYKKLLWIEGIRSWRKQWFVSNHLLFSGYYWVRRRKRWRMIRRLYYAMSLLIMITWVCRIEWCGSLDMVTTSNSSTTSINSLSFPMTYPLYLAANICLTRLNRIDDCIQYKAENLKDSSSYCETILNYPDSSYPTLSIQAHFYKAICLYIQARYSVLYWRSKELLVLNSISDEPTS